MTDIIRPEIEYSNEWTETEPDLVKSIEKYNKDRKRYLFYPWGIFVTAYNRRTLFEAIKAIGPDYVYSDTDSVKYVNPDRHQKFFEGANELIFNRAMKTVEYYGLDPELIRPKTIKGKEKKIGVWDFEGIYLRFKTLGAKRYMTETEDGISITVSGVNKRTAVPYLCRGWAYELRGRTERHSPFKLFDDSLIVPPGASGKLTHTYIDDEHSGDVVDYLGNPGHYLEYSAVHMEPAAYELSLASRYVDYLLGIRERSK